MKNHLSRKTDCKTTILRLVIIFTVTYVMCIAFTGGLKMNIHKLICVLCLVFSCNVFAEDATPVLFDQVLQLKPNQLYEVELEDVQPGDQIWTAVYLVGRQNFPGLTSKADFILENQGLLNKAKPSEHSTQQTLIAEQLTQTNQYSFHQFKALTALLDENAVQLIQDPKLEKTDTIRIYSQLNDWIPEYNTYEPIKVKFGIQNAVDFDVVAAYVLVGKGEKPAALTELNFKNIKPSYLTTSIPPIQADFSQTETNKSEYHLSRSEIKFIFFLGVLAAMAFFAFIHRGKLKRAF